MSSPIEESGAGAFDSAYALGCEGASKTDLDAQLNCLFARPYANKGFEEFMCMYADGHYPCDFSAHPNFVNGIKTWYNCTTGVNCPYK